MTKNALIFILVAILSLSGCIAPIGKVRLDKRHFSDTITIDDYSNLAAIIFSTVSGFQKKHGPYKVIWDDNFLRGFIDKKTKAKTYQVYNVIYYAGSGSSARWKYFEQVNFTTLSGQKFIPTTIIDKQEDCSALPIYGKCLYSEHVTFTVDSALLRAVASAYTPRTPMKGFWQYELIPKSGDNYKDKFLVAEIVGLLEKMDKYIIPMTMVLSETLIDHSGLVPALIPEPLIKSPPATVILPLLK